MTADRRYVLAGVVVVIGVVTGVILLEVLGTILFALTVAYVLLPVHDWLGRRGLSDWTAGVVATLIGLLGAVAVFSPIAYTLYVRSEELIDVLESVPATLTVTLAGETVTLEAVEARAWAIDRIRAAAVSLATAAPELAVKFTLFVLLLFGLLLKADAAVRATVAPVPHEYRDVVYALGIRARETLYAIYVLQLATAVGTFAVSAPLFWLLGYDAPFTLGLFAAILQFVPIVGPSLLVAPLALYELVVVGDVVWGLLVAVLGVVLIGWLPDVVVRPRLARRSAGLPGSLYFVGFTGGLFTLGPIGIVVGPLLVAIFVEAVSLLAEEVNDREARLIEAEIDHLEDARERAAEDAVEVDWGAAIDDARAEPPEESSDADEPRPSDA